MDNVHVGQFDLGKASIRGKYHNQEVELEELTAIHPAVNLTYDEFQIQIPVGVCV